MLSKRESLYSMRYAYALKMLFDLLESDRGSKSYFRAFLHLMNCFYSPQHILLDSLSWHNMPYYNIMILSYDDIVCISPINCLIQCSADIGLYSTVLYLPYTCLSTVVQSCTPV